MNKLDQRILDIVYHKSDLPKIKTLIEEVCLEVIYGNVSGVITYSNKEIALKLIEAQRQRLKKLL